MNKHTHQEDLAYLTSSFSKLLKQRFGKGPEKCFVSFHANRLTIYVHNFATPAEQVLVECNRIHLAHQFRTAVMDRVFEEFEREAASVLGASFTSYYSDWDYHSNAGIMLMDNDTSDGDDRIEPGIDHGLGEQVLSQLRRISSEAYKLPERLRLILLHANIYAVQGEGVLPPTDGLLCARGFLSVLHESSVEIKSRLARRKDAIAAAFGRAVEGLFLAWDYENDRNYIFICLQ